MVNGIGAVGAERLTPSEKAALYAAERLTGWESGLASAAEALDLLEGAAAQVHALDEKSRARLVSASTGTMGRLIVASLEALARREEELSAGYAELSARMHRATAALFRHGKWARRARR